MRGYAIKGVGFIHVREHSIRPMAIVESIVVNDEFQGLGVGSTLLRLVKNDADKEGRELWLTSVHMDPDHWTNRWYERNGFVYGEFHGYYIRKPQVPANAGSTGHSD